MCEGASTMPSYNYEQLNGESFQQLSQSLLIEEFRDIQCFPVGQPDGGRDAIARFVETTSDSGEFVVFQVKFARRELSPSEARKWLLETLRDELPKVRRQIGKGAKRFMLVTNVAGTGHQDSGSIDKLQVLLEEQIPIPATAWWRDDLDRRLDNAWDLKFAYPTLFSGTDLLRLVAEAGPSEGRTRRQIAISAFLSSQFESDREVKFKQVELENDIFNLFTDVPLVPRRPGGRQSNRDELLEAAFRRSSNSASGRVSSFLVNEWLESALIGESILGGYYLDEDAWLGAASLLLDGDFQLAEPLVIIEGAPGQGKSTISQYICQVHRMRILDEQKSDSVNPAHVDSPLRLPFKVELRDFATWLYGGNPFGATSNDVPLDPSSRSLEGFLSALVRHASGGSEFDVSDLQATLTSWPTLVVLDGLDEVAETKQRQRVVEEITSAVIRLKAIAASIQVVVTTRPTPFTNSPTFPRSSFATYSLDSLTRPLITEYADRWIIARAIAEADASDVRRILNDKLDEPHLRDLARNPMQLAILLSLIHRRGISLPDKRTALYDNYIEIFFDRESEKAIVVRDNRYLLIRIHRYLAWVLQAGAEVDAERTPGVYLTGSSRSGSISEQDLKVLLRDFLQRDGSDPSLVEKLFTGMVERVVAIVSRVEGTYEFDVQTLREYFAARHLYETAQYSPVGAERRGTISDRWKALTRNFYWLNVARFYAGCYSEGELPSLVEDLHALSHDKNFSSTSHPQLLTATLLGDWVFSQRPRAIEGAVNLLLEPRGLRLLLAGSASGTFLIEPVIVRDEIGRRQLVSGCKNMISPNLPIEQTAEIIISMLRPNTEPMELLDWWIEELMSSNEAEVSQWCAIGELLECWSVIGRDALFNLLDQEGIPIKNVISGLLHANRMDILERDEKLFEAAVEAVLAGERVGRRRGSSILQRLALSVEGTYLSRFSPRTNDAARLSLIEYLSRFRGHEDLEIDVRIPSFPAAERSARLVQAFMSAAELPVDEWNTSVDPWDRVVQQGLKEFGRRPKFVELANLAAGIRSKEVKCEDSPDLFDHQRPVVRRARYARLRAGSRNWWQRQLRTAHNSAEVQMALLLFATWAGSRTFAGVVEEFDTLVADLGTSEWQSLHSSLRSAVEVNRRRSWIRPISIRVDTLPRSLDARTVSLLVERCTPATVAELKERYLTDYKGVDPIVSSLRTDIEVHRAFQDKSEWPRAIRSLRAGYGPGLPSSRNFISSRRVGQRLPVDIAREIASRPLDYPSDLVRTAELRCRLINASKIVPVGKVATDDGWFTD